MVKKKSLLATNYEMAERRPARLSSLGWGRSLQTLSPSPSSSPSTRLGGTLPPDCEIDDEIVAPTNESSSTNKAPIFIYPSDPTQYKPSKDATHLLSKIIQNSLHKPYASWVEIPLDGKNKIFDEWKRLVFWDPVNEGVMRKIFNSRASHLLCDMYGKARNRKKRPIWIDEDVWVELCRIWNTPEWKDKSYRNKRNREKEGVVHCGGSISLGTHEMYLAKKLGRPPLPLEVYDKTHRYANGKFVSEESSQLRDKIVDYDDRYTSEGSSQTDREQAQIEAFRNFVPPNKKSIRPGASHIDALHYDWAPSMIYSSRSSSSAQADELM